MIDIAALLVWPDGANVTVCAFFWFVPGHPMLVVHTGPSAWAALQGLWAQATVTSKVTAFTRN